MCKQKQKNTKINLIIRNTMAYENIEFTNYVVKRCPKTAIYFPNFITSEEEQWILGQVEKTPKPKWTQLSHRRLINYGGVPHPNGMIVEEFPDWLQFFVDKINKLDIFESKKANHVLLNEYLAGQGIMPHSDGPLFHPIISTISCGSHGILEFYKNLKNNIEEKQLHFKLLLEPRSLLILKDSLYKDYLHSISEIEADLIMDTIWNLNNIENSYKYGERIKRETRISLTIRHVPKTSKLKLSLFK